MPDNLQSQMPHIENETRRLIAFPVNLQSFLQTTILVCTLIGGVVYADRRMTRVEERSQRTDEILNEQKELLRQMNESQQRALGNQEIMLRQLEKRK